MSDLVKGFVLGRVSEGYFKGMERTAVSLFRPRTPPPTAATIDVNGILQVAQETEEYIQKLERNTKALRQEIRELRAHSARVEDDRDRLYAWAKWAEGELKRRPKAE